MTLRYRQMLFSSSVRAEQEKMGSRRAYAGEDNVLAGPDLLGGNEAAFILARESFYLATNGAEGWPYLQHRGGPRGFVHVLDERTLGFADLRGNRQYISIGNLDSDNRASLFFMDYVNRARLKLLGNIRIVALEEGDELSDRLVPEGLKSRAERAFLIDVQAFEWNCPQYIPQLIPTQDVTSAINQLQNRIRELEAKLAARELDAG